jgi:hypothetical protein
VRTPSKEKAGGYYQAVLFTTRAALGMREVVDHYDDRAGIEADLKSDKGGLGLAVIRKRRLAAQMLVVLLMQLAHNVLIWSRQWLAALAPRLAKCGIGRLVREVWAIRGASQTGRPSGATGTALPRPSPRTGRLLRLPSLPGTKSNPGLLVRNLGSWMIACSGVPACWASNPCAWYASTRACAIRWMSMSCVK